MVDSKAVMIPVSVIDYIQDQAAITGNGLKAEMKVITKGNERVFPNGAVIEKAD